MSLQPISNGLRFTKNDSEDPRLGERVQAILRPPASQGVVVWGSPDDEGIRLNGGRPGAAEAPDEIRRFLYKMTPPAIGDFPDKIFDLGNFEIAGPLPERHAKVRKLSAELHAERHFCLSLGGGHDYGFPDVAGFLDATLRTARPLVVNFDAHLDVRPADQSFHSGTPFRRLLETFPNQFEFCEMGLQPQCNSRFHADWARQQGARLVFLDEMKSSTPGQLGFNHEPGRPCFLSLDIDVFSSKEAPGCSQSWASGLVFDEFLPWLQFFISNYDVRGLGFFEVSPALDQDHRTSKLAAVIAYHALALHAARKKR